MGMSTWHLTGPLGHRELVARFDATLSPGKGPGSDSYIELRAQYFEDLRLAATRRNIGWLPALGDVFVRPGEYSHEVEVEEILRGILAETVIRRGISRPDPGQHDAA